MYMFTYNCEEIWENQQYTLFQSSFLHTMVAHVSSLNLPLQREKFFTVLEKNIFLKMYIHVHVCEALIIVK